MLICICMAPLFWLAPCDPPGLTSCIGGGGFRLPILLEPGLVRTRLVMLPDWPLDAAPCWSPPLAALILVGSLGVRCAMLDMDAGWIPSRYGLDTCWPAAIGSSRGRASAPMPSSACTIRLDSPRGGALTSNWTSTSRPRILFRVSVITLVKRFSSHSLAKLLGTAITTAPSLNSDIEVVRSQVWKLGPGTLSCSSPSAACHTCLAFIRPSSYDATCALQETVPRFLSPSFALLPHKLHIAIGST